MSRHPMNPWRKGVQAGKAYYEAFDLYRQSLRGDSPLPRPEMPKNPYPVPTSRSKNAGARQWEDGMRSARLDFEARQRCGGKAPSWSHR